MSLRVKELEMLRCPSCGGSLTVGGGGGLSCGDCRRTYPPLGEYHDFFVEEGIRPGSSYPRELEHLLFTKEKILLLKHRNAGEAEAWVPGSSSHVREWNRQLDRLQREGAGEVLFHTEFTRREIELLLSRAGLSVERISPETVSEKDPAALRSILRKVLTGGQDYRPWFALARKTRKRRHPSRKGTSGSPESSEQGSDAGSP